MGITLKKHHFTNPSELYNQMPFPWYGDDPLTKDYLGRKKYIDLSLDFRGEGFNVWNDKKVLEGGCGTGRESMYMASQGANLTSIDITDKSLEVAKKHASMFDFKHDINFKKASVLDIPFEDNHFDIVLSSGVIMLTKDARKAFSELARVLKPGGFLVLFVYDYYGHIIPDIRRTIVNWFAGKDLHKRAVIAQKLFPFYVKNMDLTKIYDEFSLEFKTTHSLKEIFGWFRENQIEYENVYPKFGFKGALQSKYGRKKYIREGVFDPINDKWSKKTSSNIIASNIKQFLGGFNGYSGGYRVLGVKSEK